MFRKYVTVDKYIIHLFLRNTTFQKKKKKKKKKKKRKKNKCLLQRKHRQIEEQPCPTPAKAGSTVDRTGERQWAKVKLFPMTNDSARSL